MNKVVGFPPSATFTPEQALNSALQLNPTDVICVGYGEDGRLIIRSSKMSRQDAVFLLAMATKWAIEE